MKDAIAKVKMYDGHTGEIIYEQDFKDPQLLIWFVKKFLADKKMIDGIGEVDIELTPAYAEKLEE